MSDVIEVLASIDIFETLEPDGLERVAARCRHDRYCQNQTIFSYGDHSTDVYFIKSGCVQITMFSQNGREIAFRQLTAGNMFGEIAAIDHLPRSTAAVSRSRLELIRLSDQDFREIMSDMPDVAFAVMRRLTFLVRALSDRVIEYTTHDVHHRILAELLRLAKAHGGGAEVVNIHPAPTHADIASQVSTHREAVTREFKQLANEGILERRGRNLIVRDVQRLERMVNETEA